MHGLKYVPVASIIGWQLWEPDWVSAGDLWWGSKLQRSPQLGRCLFGTVQRWPPMELQKVILSYFWLRNIFFSNEAKLCFVFPLNFYQLHKVWLQLTKGAATVLYVGPLEDN